MLTPSRALWLCAALVAAAPVVRAEPEHPFLLCKREQFDALRRRASRQPFKAMAMEATAASLGGFKPNLVRGDDGRMRAGGAVTPRSFAVRLAEHSGACALAYIVDAGRRRRHAMAVYDCIHRHLRSIEFGKGANGWEAVVPPMSAAFNCIIALDIVRGDLTPAQITTCEEVIESQIRKVRRHSASWPAARLGTYGTWDIYKGKATGPDDAYYNVLVRQMTDDGVATRSAGYALARLIGTTDRVQKAAYMDVLEFTGVDRRYYRNEKLGAFMRWYFAHGVNPGGYTLLFGDMTPDKKDSVQLPYIVMPAWRVSRFNEEAGRYAARLLRGKRPPGHVIPYLLMPEKMPQPLMPVSELYMKGGAFLRERVDNERALGGALYNITSGVGFHTHQEVNALALCAYGNNLLVNGGWLAPSTRPARRNNTLSIDGGPHASMTGAGLEEGLVGGDLEYAAGLSGGALGDDAFVRSLIMLHGRGRDGGYFVVVDEVHADPGEKVHTYWQTASQSKIAEAAPRREYRAVIDHHARAPGVGLTVFYATEPGAVTQDVVPSGTIERVGSHRRLEAVYPTDNDGDRRIVTVLFPSDRAHPKATMTRLAGDGFTGANVAYRSGVTDAIYACDGEAECADGDVTFRARAVVTRMSRRSLVSYFARKARQLAVGGVGFDSDADVSIYMSGLTGMITSEGAAVTFRSPGIRSVKIGDAVAGASDQPGEVRVRVPAGRHAVTLTTRPVAPAAP